MAKRIALINGPNLNLLGLRKPEIYGHIGLAQIIETVRGIASVDGYEVLSFQSNHEGDLIDYIHGCAIGEEHDRAEGIILNAGGLSHTSVSLRDAVEAVADLGVPTIEVHISDIKKREPFRHHSYLTEVCINQISGLGGYLAAAYGLIDHITKRRP